MNESGVLLEGTAKGYRLLFVDDNIENAQLLAKTATAFGHDAAWASTEAEARTILASRTVDALITDYYLEPEAIEGGGARLTALVHSGCRSTPCVVVTGFSPGGTLKTMTSVLEALGDVIVLHKPQEPKSLFSIVRSLIEAKMPIPPTTPIETTEG